MQLTRQERERRILDTAARLFYARGVHEVGMDELIAESGLAKATVYRLYPTKDALVGAYLQRLAAEILGSVDAEIVRHGEDPAAALHAILAAIERDLRRSTFRGCAFNNASIEFDDPDHPARAAAREYRQALHTRLATLARQLTGEPEPGLGAELAVLVDGLYTNTAHLGPDGPALAGLALARRLIDTAARG
jgi:AcrR family transcriptional regulator